MSDARQDRLADLVFEASKLSPSGQRKFVEDACEGDLELCNDVLELLEGLQHVLPLLEVPSLARAGLPETLGANRSEVARRVLERLSGRHKTEARYDNEGEFARGGMGTILKVWDRDLRRRIAMKVLHDSNESGLGASQDEMTLGRFLEEAQITAQLQHPGIVPVHELGVDDSGKLYFTMQLVKGSTFRDVIQWVEEGKDGWTVTRALAVLLDACDALSYAHSKGVIHRDLKPQNVMVGRFGETYVMDWGVARIVGEEDHHDLRIKDSSTLTRVRSDRRDGSDSDAESPLITMDGMVVGTPTYMPPEQALGKVENIDARSDVYAIGAMLYHLLAGRGPYAEPGARMSPRTILALVIQGPPRPLHMLRHGLPPELVAICEKAMAREPAERYADTLALAQDLRAYLEHRVVSAHRTGALIELRKWIVRNRLAAAAFLVAAFAFLGGSGTIAFVKSDANSKLRESKSTLEEKNAQLIAAHAQADAHRAHAQQNFEKARDAIGQIVEVAREHLLHVPRLEEVRTALFEQALSHYQELLDPTEDDPRLRHDQAMTQADLAGLSHDLGDETAAEELYETALDELRSLPKNQAGKSIVAASLAKVGAMYAVALQSWGRLSEAEQQLRDALDLTHGLLQGAPKSSAIRELMGECQLRLGRVLEQAGGRDDEALELYGLASDRSWAEFLGPRPGKWLATSAKALLMTAWIRRSRNQYQTAEEAFRESLRQFSEVANLSALSPWIRADLGHCHRGLGLALRDRAQPSEALVEIGMALDIHQRLCEEFPGFREFLMASAEDHQARAACETDLDDFAAAEQSYRKCFSLLEEGSAKDQAPALPDVVRAAIMHADFGGMLWELGRLEEAEREFQRALDLRRTVLQRAPTIEALREAAHDARGLAIALNSMNRVEEAAVVLEEARDLLNQALERSPDDVRTRHIQALCLASLGPICIDLGRTAEAVSVLEEAVSIRKALAETLSEDLEQRLRLMEAYCFLGKVHRKTGKYENAKECFRQSIAIATEIGESALSDYYFSVLRQSQDWLGGAYKDSGELQKAVEAYEVAIATARRGLERKPESVGFRSNLGASLNNLGMVLLTLGELEHARDLFEEAIEHQKFCAQAQPQTVAYSLYLRNHYLGMNRVCQELGNYRNVVDSSETLAQLGESRGEESRELCRRLARCVELIKADSAISTEERAAQVSSCVAQATHWLRCAVDAGFRDIDSFVDSPDFKAIRNEDSFKKTIDELRALIR